MKMYFASFANYQASSEALVNQMRPSESALPVEGKMFLFLQRVPHLSNNLKNCFICLYQFVGQNKAFKIIALIIGVLTEKNPPYPTGKWQINGLVQRWWFLPSAGRSVRSSNCKGSSQSADQTALKCSLIRTLVVRTDNIVELLLLWVSVILLMASNLQEVKLQIWKSIKVSLSHLMCINLWCVASEICQQLIVKMTSKFATDDSLIFFFIF